jgi:hypothetical protein
MKLKSLFFILIFSTSAFAQRDLKISQFGLSLQSENYVVGLDYGRKSSLTPGFMIDFSISPKTDVGVEINLRRNYFGSGSLLSHNYLSFSVLYKSKFKRFTFSIGPTVDQFVGVWEDKENTSKIQSPFRKQTYGLTARIEYKLLTFSKNYVLTPFVKINPQIIYADRLNLGLGIILSKKCKNDGKD